MEVLTLFLVIWIIFCIKAFSTSFFEGLGQGVAEKVLTKNKKTTPKASKRKSG